MEEDIQIPSWRPETNGNRLDSFLGKVLVWFFRWLLELIFDAASLIIDVIRTFYLIVLAILGPLAFAISIFDGFQNSLVQWLSKYISVSLWLPISDLFGAILARIQNLSLSHDITMMQTDSFYLFNANSTVYLIFLLVGIFGYFTIPSIASWIVQASGFGSYNRMLVVMSNKVLNTGGAIAGSAVGKAVGGFLTQRKAAKGSQS